MRKARKYAQTGSHHIARTTVESWLHIRALLIPVQADARQERPAVGRPAPQAAPRPAPKRVRRRAREPAAPPQPTVTARSATAAQGVAAALIRPKAHTAAAASTAPRLERPESQRAQEASDSQVDARHHRPVPRRRHRRVRLPVRHHRNPPTGDHRAGRENQRVLCGRQNENRHVRRAEP